MTNINDSNIVKKNIILFRLENCYCLIYVDQTMLCNDLEPWRQ